MNFWALFTRIQKCSCSCQISIVYRCSKFDSTLIELNLLSDTSIANQHYCSTFLFQNIGGHASQLQSAFSFGMRFLTCWLNIIFMKWILGTFFTSISTLISGVSKLYQILSVFLDWATTTSEPGTHDTNPQDWSNVCLFRVPTSTSTRRVRRSRYSSFVPVSFNSSQSTFESWTTSAKGRLYSRSTFDPCNTVRI